MLDAMKDQRTNLDTPQIADTPHGQIARQLQDAINKPHVDVARVELWASALSSLAQPIPHYSPSQWHEFNRACTAAPNSARERSAKPAEAT